jgi:glyoxylase-like metal-dependent hydrolase (beta-lactamase superfamily II)
LDQELQSVDITPDDVDIVVHSHLHPDHVGGNIDGQAGDARLAFPNARYLVSETMTDEVTLASAPGQTPGHVIVEIRSDGQRALLVADAILHRAQITR